MDFLLGVGKIARQHAPRFKDAPDGAFLASGERANIPAVIRLGELLSAAMRLAADNGDDSDPRLILAPGSSPAVRAPSSVPRPMALGADGGRSTR